MEDTTITRRDALKLSVLGAAVTALPFTVSLRGAQASELPANQLPRPYVNAFSTPPTIGPGVSSTEITQRRFDAFLLPGGRPTPMWGYNGTFPGPTIRVDRRVSRDGGPLPGQPLTVVQRNDLPETHPLFGHRFSTSTHLHGAPSLPQYDGYANDLSHPGYLKPYVYENTEDARTLWYHDHAVHHTANNVYTGLAGQYHLLDRAQDTALGLPQDRFDLPLMIGDVAFRSDGGLLYDDRSESGHMGDVIVVNGVPWPVARVQPRRYRFRVLNASIARGYDLQLSGSMPMTVVATDGGLLRAPATVSRLRMSMAERYDVVMDFTGRSGQRIELRNNRVDNTIDYDNTNKIMVFDVSEPLSTDPNPPINTSAWPSADPQGVLALTGANAVRRRRLAFERQNGEWAINDLTWADVERSGFTRTIADPQVNTVEEWVLENRSGGWFHPIHIHLVDFRVLSRTDGRGRVQTYEDGPKDVLYLGENETVRIVARFGPHAGRYMLHCHNTTHEDHDMMHQFRVVGPNEQDPFSVPPTPWR
jgi:FtsP/CotA-like multicopper oxidase with cupredoxin domain